MKYYLVYIKCNGFVHAQIWHSVLTNGEGKERTENILKKIAISEIEAKLSINQLKEKYPYEEAALSVYY